MSAFDAFWRSFGASASIWRPPGAHLAFSVNLALATLSDKKSANKGIDTIKGSEEGLIALNCAKGYHVSEGIIISFS
jgi:hypothetical protein